MPTVHKALASLSSIGCETCMMLLLLALELQDLSFSEVLYVQTTVAASERQHRRVGIYTVLVHLPSSDLEHVMHVVYGGNSLRPRSHTETHSIL